jgi:hypothetical protein
MAKTQVLEARLTWAKVSFSMIVEIVNKRPRRPFELGDDGWSWPSNRRSKMGTHCAQRCD